MARTITYQQLYDNIKSLGLINAITADQNVTVGISGTITVNIAPYQDAILKLDFKEYTDEAFSLKDKIQSTASDPSLDELFGINNKNNNIYQPEAKGGSIIHNADRIIVNAKEDFAMVFGKKGVAIASPGRVNIDAGKTITLFSKESVFLGVPNRGKKIPEDKGQKQLGTTKGDPTPDFLYEPIVLGVKLANLLDDIIYTIQNADMASALSQAKWQPSAIGDLELLRNRIPEILSNYAYIDGISHEKIDLEQLKKLEAAQKTHKKSVPPKSLIASVNAEISPPVDTLVGPSGADNYTGAGGPIGANTTIAGSGGGTITAGDKTFAAKYNGGVLPCSLYADGTAAIAPGEYANNRPPKRVFYIVNPAYSAKMGKATYYYQGGLKTVSLHPDFALKVGPAMVEINSVGGGQYINNLGGGIVCRNVTDGNRLSHHAWGLALDMNTGKGSYTGVLAGTSSSDWGWNTKWSVTNQTCKGKAWTSAHRGFYEKVAKIMMKHGIGWYYPCDAMHFSIYEGTPLS